MTTPKKSGPMKSGPKKSGGKKATRVKRKAPTRTGPIRTGGDLPDNSSPPSSAKGGHSDRGQPVGMSPQAHADALVDEGMINQAVADTVRNANQVFSDTVAQARVAAENFRHGDYNMRDVPVDVEIMGRRMLKLARELSETTFNIIEQLLKQMTQVPPPPSTTGKGHVPPFPTGGSGGSYGASPGDGDGAAPPSSSSSGTDPTGGNSGAPPSSVPGPSPADNRALNLVVKFEGTAKAHAMESPLWKPAKPTLPSQLSITPMQHMLNEAEPIHDVTFEADLDGQLIATITIPPKQPAGVYAGIIVPDNTDVPLGILTIEIVE